MFSVSAILAGLGKATGKQILGGGLGFVVAAVVMGGLVFGHKRAVSKSYDKGADSRQEEVDTLTSERDTARAARDGFKIDLDTCRGNNTQLQADLSSAQSKLSAQADEARAKLKLQAETFEAAQRANRDAMDALARTAQQGKVDFKEIFDGLKGLSYAYDADTNRCVIVGGANQLRDAARGKSTRG